MTRSNYSQAQVNVAILGLVLQAIGAVVVIRATFTACANLVAVVLP